MAFTRSQRRCQGLGFHSGVLVEVSVGAVAGAQLVVTPCSASGRKSQTSACPCVCPCVSAWAGAISGAGWLGWALKPPLSLHLSAGGTAETHPGMRLLLRGAAAGSGAGILQPTEARLSRKPRREVPALWISPCRVHAGWSFPLVSP